ncbi:hypothetical protein CDAR_256891 [Caerostris darwini]|uniref:Uncharacterized protein n=1 Tax=Caerostris darwini TaxID=1538125 RepID=A0AAV4Q161_9ARAC|nr:hypothetical protein CDAR_256891 [Caerostris darwini]
MISRQLSETTPDPFPSGSGHSEAPLPHVSAHERHDPTQRQLPRCAHAQVALLVLRFTNRGNDGMEKKMRCDWLKNRQIADYSKLPNEAKDCRTWGLFPHLHLTVKVNDDRQMCPLLFAPAEHLHVFGELSLISPALNGALSKKSLGF